MNHQETPQPASRPKLTGRPLWQVSLKASVQRIRKRRRAKLYAAVRTHCAACQPRALELT
jgi:hypothetical protein